MALTLVGAVIAATAQKITECKDLLTVFDEHQRTVYYNRESGKPLKGEYRIKRGLDLETVKFKNGMMDGEYRRYRNGELREAGNYALGKRDGLFTEYHVGGKTVMKETPMSNGKIDGTVRTYFSNGALDTEKNYKMSVENGKERHFDKTDGKPVYEANYANGKKDGMEWKTTDDGHGMRSNILRHYKNGVLHGNYRNELMRNDGTLVYLVTGQYANGEKTGQWNECNCETGAVETKWHGKGNE